MGRNILTVNEVAAYIGKHSDTIYTMAKLNQLPLLQVGTDMVFTKESLDLWMKDQELTILQTNL